MDKIIVIGCSGAGKSTFARKISTITNIPLYHLDMIWHKSDKTTISEKEFDEKLGELLKKKQYIIDGTYSRTIERRIKECDTIYLFDLPTDVCLAGVESRIGKNREDMPWIEYEFDEEFKEYIIGFKEKELKLIYKLIDKYNKYVIIFKSREDAEDYLNMRLTTNNVKYKNRK